MPIVVKLDVMLAQRKMRSRELAERIGITEQNLSLLKSGKVRGVRTTMKSSHLDMDKHVRAAMSGIIGSILGSTRTFISANTVHQAPPGGGLCACIVRKAS